VALFDGVVRARKKAADLFAEHADRFVGQLFGEIDQIGQDSGAATLGAEILRQPGWCRTPLAHELLPAFRMNFVPARRIEGQPAQKIEPIEQSIEIGAARRIRPGAEPAEPRLTNIGIEGDDRIERRQLFRRAIFQNSEIGLLPGNCASCAADFVQPVDSRQKNLPVSETFYDSLADHAPFIGGGRRGDSREKGRAPVVSVGGTQRKILLNFESMLSSGLITARVVGKNGGADTNLFAHKVQKAVRCRENAAGIALATRRYSPVCRDTGPPHQAGFVFLGLGFSESAANRSASRAKRRRSLIRVNAWG